MKKPRAFKLGRRLVRIWRWVFRRRHPKRYLRLNPTPPRSQYRSVILPRSISFGTTTVTAKLADWGRLLARRLRRRGPVAGGLITGGDAGAGGWEVEPAAGLLENQEGVWRPPPKGHLAVYVGRKDGGGPPQRYVVPVIYFNHPLFGELLRDAEEEYGFHHPGGITIPCPVSHFERVQTRIATGRRRTTAWAHS